MRVDGATEVSDLDNLHKGITAIAPDLAFAALAEEEFARKNAPSFYQPLLDQPSKLTEGDYGIIVEAEFIRRAESGFHLRQGYGGQESRSRDNERRKG